MHATIDYAHTPYGNETCKCHRFCAPNIGTNNIHQYSKWKSLLHDIYNLEDLKIKVERSERIRDTIHHLCIETIKKEDLESLLVSFNKVKNKIIFS